ncbi:MAG: NAD-dependent epimerase/dehydratase family protein [Chloroflexota bacterium]
MRKKVIFITGVAGEIGQALLREVAQTEGIQALTLDLQPLPPELQGLSHHVQGDILNQSLLRRLITEYDVDTIYHLAALLSTRAEFAPELAHRVNVDGTLALLQLAAEQSERRGVAVKFIFPSSIAVYGMPDQVVKQTNPQVKEWEWNEPATMYGCNKLYCERLGVYFSHHYQQLAANPGTRLDFRCVRFPGLISAFTAPTGGTSDYGPEMLHAAAKGEPYACFVREEATIPFMTMPDAVIGLRALARAPQEVLSRRVYNITSFSLSAAEFKAQVLRAFPGAEISFEPDVKRQAIVDSWPAGLNDDAARSDWDWQPDYGVDRAFDDYLVPNIRERYK